MRDDRHDSAWLFGAICPKRAGAAVVVPWVSSEAMSVHLAEISKVVGPTAHCVLICDGAGWHQSGERLAVPSNVTLLRLPPYAPELNPIENVWEYLRGNYLGHIVWDTYEQIVEACCSAWNLHPRYRNRDFRDQKALGIGHQLSRRDAGPGRQKSAEAGVEARHSSSFGCA